MKQIGLTGGIGSGKSTVGAMFRTLGIPVYISDIRAKILMDTDDDVRQKIKALLGAEAYRENGKADSAFIASKVFTSPELLKHLNAIIHPAVGADFTEWASWQDDAPYLLKESAILFEENLTDDLDAAILVVAPEPLRIERVMQRDGAGEEKVRQRIERQWPDEKKIPLADFIIYNDGRRLLTQQVLEVHHMIGSVCG